ncbi:MAG: hypothetical protein H6719_18125 [Sandaracinaceae bacterium]|nr:hypothetical protein [Sandaracinaceae bacterium]
MADEKRSEPKGRRKRRALIFAAVSLLLVGALWVPDVPPEIVPPANRQPFVWGADPLWQSLEQRFDEAREAGCEATTPELDAALLRLHAAIEAIEGEPARLPADPAFDELEGELFGAAPLFGACPDRIPELVPWLTRLRAAVKVHSEAWDIEDRPTRDRVYRLLYGSRATLEELILQAPEDSIPPLIRGTDEPSETPSTVVHGVRVHSGDVLVSRGGAPASALIARGNDYPGNFSHIALLHVDEHGTPRVIESHPETGVVVSEAATYLHDTKLRIMVLRTRANHPSLVANPQLPHEAATAAMEAARAGHIPYDFRMNQNSHDEQFCSEVPAAVYEAEGMRLWLGLSSMSGEGLTRWLSVLGVDTFETLNPSDLEYDPQLRVVAEWRDVETLFEDHMDNAIFDALIERADAGEMVDYDFGMLGPARVIKAYSVIATLFGSHGPIPEGMTATTGLRVQWVRGRYHDTRARLLRAIAGYRQAHHRRPPYWRLLALARIAAED